MPLPIPNLDDRSFDDLMKEAKTLIPLYCNEWTNYNPSDPGITLLELFSWLCEMVIYRINQVPEENYRKFLKLLGVESRNIGSGTISSEKTDDVTGDGTIFYEELKVGDLIIARGQIKTITAIISDSLLTIDSSFDTDMPAGTNFTYLSEGTGTISSDGKVVTGDGTIFASELKIGDSITFIGSTRSEDQNRRIMNIYSDTSLLIDSKFYPSLEGGKFYHSYQSIESAICEGLNSLSQRYRAITVEDYEFLAMECMEALQKGLAGKAICVNNRDLEYRKEDFQPGYVSVIIIPTCNEKSSYCDHGLPTDELKKKIKDHLDARKLITTRVRVVGSDYHKVKLEVWVSLKENTLDESVKNEAVEHIKRYYDPIKGGKDGKGWMLGRPIYRSEIFQLLEGVKGVDHVVKVKINDSYENLPIENFQLILLDPDPVVNIQ